MSIEKRVTLKMIAEEVGCSVAIVSSVLNAAKGRSKASPELRTRVLATAQRLDYMPYFASRCLKNNTSKTLGIYVQPGPWHTMANAYEMTILSGIELAVRQLDYDILILNINQSKGSSICEDRLKSGKIDGILLLRCTPASWVDKLLQINRNIIAIDLNTPYPGLTRFAFDNEKAVQLVLEKLLQSGHRRIAFIGSCVETPETDALLREKAFSTAVCEKNLTGISIFNRSVCPVRISKEEDYCQQEGREAIYYFHTTLSRMQLPDAFICYNSYVAQSLQYYAEKVFGYVIPRDFSLISIDDMQDCRFGNMQISCCKHSLMEMGYDGTNMLIEAVENPSMQLPALKVYDPIFLPGETLLKRDC